MQTDFNDIKTAVRYGRILSLLLSNPLSENVFINALKTHQSATTIII